VRQILITVKEELQRAKAYCEAIAGMMRNDPDVLMLGEIRYGEVAKAAIDAALTGHAVWTTIHANNAFGIISRMRSLMAWSNPFGENETDSQNPLELLCDPNVLAGLEYQRLIPVLCPACKIKMLDIPEKERGNFIPKDVEKRLITRADNIENVHVRGEGCDECHSRGLSGLTVAAEFIATDQKMLSFLRSGYTDKAYEYWQKEYGGISYIQHALNQIQMGTVDPYLVEERLGVPLDFQHVFSGAKL